MHASEELGRLFEAFLSGPGLTSLGRARSAVALLEPAILSIVRLVEVLERVFGEVGVFGVGFFG